MIISSIMIVGGGLALGLHRRPVVDVAVTGRVLREVDAYADTATATVPAEFRRLTRKIEPVLKIVGKDS